jgi:hypothetical protein
MLEGVSCSNLVGGSSPSLLSVLLVPGRRMLLDS